MAKNSAAVGLALKADPSEPLRVLVAWSPTNGSSESLEVAAWLARTTPVRLRVLSTFIQPWGGTSLNKTGGKYKKWLREETNAVERAVKDALTERGIDKNAWAKRYSVVVDGADRPQLITDAAQDFNADVILLSPSHSAPKNRVFAGSTADALLHYSPVTLGLTPRRVKLSKHGVTRINFAYTNERGKKTDPALHTAATLAARFGVPLRILAFSPTGLVRAPMNDKLDVAKELTSDWREHSLALLDVARDAVFDAHPELDVTTDIGSGKGWRGAVDSLKWKKGDLMFLGSNPMGAFSRVFIGSTATELLPHLSVPVLVHPVQRP